MSEPDTKEDTSNRNAEYFIQMGNQEVENFINSRQPQHLNSALDYYENAKTAQGNLPIAYGLKGMVYSLLNKYDLAIKEFENEIFLSSYEHPKFQECVQYWINSYFKVNNGKGDNEGYENILFLLKNYVVQNQDGKYQIKPLLGNGNFFGEGHPLINLITGLKLWKSDERRDEALKVLQKTDRSLGSERYINKILAEIKQYDDYLTTIKREIENLDPLNNKKEYYIKRKKYAINLIVVGTEQSLAQGKMILKDCMELIKEIFNGNELKENQLDLLRELAKANLKEGKFVDGRKIYEDAISLVDELNDLDNKIKSDIILEYITSYYKENNEEEIVSNQTKISNAIEKAKSYYCSNPKIILVEVELNLYLKNYVEANKLWTCYSINYKLTPLMKSKQNLCKKLI